MNEATHKKHMLEILTDIYQNPFLAHNLYFKGGTALFLFHDLPRFSTDLDFDIRAGCGDRNRVFEELKQIVSRYGNLREATKKRYTFFFLLSYEKYKRTIKVEASLRNYGHEGVEIKNIFGTDLKVLALDFICAHKLVALSERTKARDLFDAYFILVNDLPINEKIIKIRTGKSLKQFLAHLVQSIEKNFSRQNVLHELAPIIGDKKKNWVRDHLKKELLKLIKDRK